jgi:inward rectifier potassium channel
VTGKEALPQFLQAFFFSAQTITTVGYGHIHPGGLLANITAALESFIGILTFAVITGIVYGRFSKPRAFLRFSENALISPFRDGWGLMFRLSGYKNNSLTEVRAMVVVAMHVNEKGTETTRFFNLSLDIPTISSLTTSWTIVHPLDSKSPIYGLDQNELIRRKTEFMVQISAIDEHLSYTVQQKTSYLPNEIVFGARFEPMVTRSGDGQYSVIHLDKLNSFQRTEIPFSIKEGSQAPTSN